MSCGLSDSLENQKLADCRFSIWAPTPPMLGFARGKHRNSLLEGRSCDAPVHRTVAQTDGSLSLTDNQRPGPTPSNL